MIIIPHDTPGVTCVTPDLLMAMVVMMEGGYRGEGGVVAVSNSGIWIYNFETWGGPGW